MTDLPKVRALLEQWASQDSIAGDTLRSLSIFDDTDAVLSLLLDNLLRDRHRLLETLYVVQRRSTHVETGELQ